MQVLARRALTLVLCVWEVGVTNKRREHSCNMQGLAGIQAGGRYPSMMQTTMLSQMKLTLKLG